MELYSEEDLDFLWPAKNKLAVADGHDNGPQNYLSWMHEYSRAAQVSATLLCMYASQNLALGV